MRRRRKRKEKREKRKENRTREKEKHPFLQHGRWCATSPPTPSRASSRLAFWSI
jgi:hypothetical protein